MCALTIFVLAIDVQVLREGRYYFSFSRAAQSQHARSPAVYAVKNASRVRPAEVFSRIMRHYFRTWCMWRSVEPYRACVYLEMAGSTIYCTWC